MKANETLKKWNKHIFLICMIDLNRKISLCWQNCLREKLFRARKSKNHSKGLLTSLETTLRRVK